MATTVDKDGTKSSVTWQWADDKLYNTWNLYDTNVQNHIESGYQHGLPELDLHEKFHTLPFILNFQAMTQTSKRTGFTRSIRRSMNDICAEDIKPHQALTSSISVENCAPTTRAHSRSRRARKKEMDGEFSNEESSLESRCVEQSSGKHSLRQSRSNDSFDLRNKKTKSTPAVSEGPNFENSTLLQKLTSPARALANLFKSKKVPRKNYRSKIDSMSIYNYHRHPDGKPVPNVKLPSDIHVLDSDEKTVKLVDEVLNEYTTTVCSIIPEDDCCICCESLTSTSSYDVEDIPSEVLSLNLCSHMFHKSCITAMYNSNNQRGFLQCPTCKIIYGVKVGNQPEGRMDYQVVPLSLPGYADCNTIMITYLISGGIQGPEHPLPGQPFTARGFPRHCYLPDNEEGRKILQLLVIAWERRLIFTIGTSTTTGECGTVTWNEIHHKTEFGSNYSGHGYPDPMYMENVMQELALQGVTTESISQDSLV